MAGDGEDMAALEERLRNKYGNRSPTDPSTVVSTNTTAMAAQQQPLVTNATVSSHNLLRSLTSLDATRHCTSIDRVRTDAANAFDALLRTTRGFTVRLSS